MHDSSRGGAGRPREANVSDLSAPAASRRNKLSPEQVLAIRGRYAAGGITQRELAVEYRVSKDAVSDVVTGKTWRYLPMPDQASPGAAGVAPLPRPAAREVTPGTWTVESALNAGRVFTIRRGILGFSCDCPTGRYGNRVCWHIAQVEALLDGAEPPLASPEDMDEPRRAA